MNAIVALLHDTAHDRWHPILFREAPLPGGGGPTRHKSVWHDTDGFGTREEAVAECEAFAKTEHAQLCVSKAFAWDGEGIPAMVVFFGEREGQLVPLIA